MGATDATVPALMMYVERTRRFIGKGLPQGLVPFLLGALAILVSGCSTVRSQPFKDEDALRDMVQLTRPAVFEDATAGRFSPDLQWIAFRATPVGQQAPQLFIARVLHDGDAIVGLGNPVQITPSGSRNDSPTFGPDGRTLAFVSTGADTATDERALAVGFDALAEIFRVDQWQRNLAAGDVRTGVNLARHAISNNRGFDGEPAFSPDGAYLAFASDRAAPGSALEKRSLVDVYIARADGSEAVRVTDAQGYDGAPAWTPDGNAIVFHSDRRFSGRFDIYRLDLKQTGSGYEPVAPPVRLTRTIADAGTFAKNPAVHPDGDILVYVRQHAADAEAGTTHLWQMRLDGEREFALTFGDDADDSPSFSADGRFLLFSSRRTPDGSRQLYVARYLKPRRS